MKSSAMKGIQQPIDTPSNMRDTTNRTKSHSQGIARAGMRTEIRRRGDDVMQNVM
jgi:hypothetical protein